MEGRERVIRNGMRQSHIYEWKTYVEYADRTFKPTFSPFFIFCGLYCRLNCQPVRLRRARNYYCFIEICLNGYPAPYQKNVSCYYSLTIITNDGEEQMRKTELTEDGRIHSSDKTMHVSLNSDVIAMGILNKPFTICFSWCEDENFDGAQQGMSTNGIECASQTEDVQFLDSRNIRPNAEMSANIIERSTQTESSSYAGDIFTDKENESFKFLEILSQDLGSFYENKADPDCVLKVDATEFHVHRSVLAARSTVFEAMFHHDTSESRSGEVDIRDVDAASFSDVLYYIYAGKIRGLSPDTAASMYVVADKYALVDFRDKCLDFLMHNLTVDNICEAALLAHTHAEMKLEDKITEFIEERLDDLSENERWKMFSDTHSKLANKLLFSAFISSKKKLAK